MHKSSSICDYDNLQPKTTTKINAKYSTIFFVELEAKSSINKKMVHPQFDYKMTEQIRRKIINKKKSLSQLPYQAA